MDLLHPIYKCRLCGEVVRPANAYEATGSITCFQEALQILRMKQNVAHACENSEKNSDGFKVGICDFVGIHVERDTHAKPLNT